MSITSSRLACNLPNLGDIVLAECLDLGQNLLLALCLPLSKVYGHPDSNGRGKQRHGKRLVVLGRQDSIYFEAMSAKAMEEECQCALETSYPCPGRHCRKSIRRRVLGIFDIVSDFKYTGQSDGLVLIVTSRYMQVSCTEEGCRARRR